MSAKHTPGPWTLRGKHLDIGTDTYCVASDWGGSNWKNDATLIAAAPELLDALRKAKAMIHDHLHILRGGADVYKSARAAIAKAEGAL